MKQQPSPNLSFRPVRASDLDLCIAIETASYPADEAASPAALQYRQAVAGEYFYCACDNDNNSSDDDDNNKVIGFVCATRCATFSHESMSTHDAKGPLLAIHSVVVRQDYRRQGIASKMLRHYVQAIEAQERNKLLSSQQQQEPVVSKMVLLAKAHLLGFYVNCGFTVTRPSPIVHGQEMWYELEKRVLLMPNDANTTKPCCFVVDAFGQPGQRGTGNPAAVVLLEKGHHHHPNDQAWMQTVAAEFNLSETAFVWPLVVDDNNDGDDDKSSSANNNNKKNIFAIRYFTPTMQVPLCGHATLAAASVLYQTGRVARNDETVQLQAMHDLLQARTVDGDATHISMTFPVKPAVEIVNATDRAAALEMLQQAFGLQSNQITWLGVSDGIGDLLVQVTSPALVRNPATIRYEPMKAYNGYSRGIILTSLVADGEADFCSRFFAPLAGINEDPVTGSAHTVLVPHYHAATNERQRQFKAEQWSPRGGWLTCTLLLGDDGQESVEIAGRAVTTLQGNLE